MKSKYIYKVVIGRFKPLVEENYPLLRWKKIWENLHNSVIGVKERDFLYRYLHETLATNKRLELLKKRDNGNCCRCGDAEYSLHVFYFCKDIKVIVNWLKVKLSQVCKISSKEFLKRFDV